MLNVRNGHVVEPVILLQAMQILSRSQISCDPLLPLSSLHESSSIQLVSPLSRQHRTTLAISSYPHSCTSSHSRSFWVHARGRRCTSHAIALGTSWWWADIPRSSGFSVRLLSLVRGVPLALISWRSPTGVSCLRLSICPSSQLWIEVGKRATLTWIWGHTWSNGCSAHWTTISRCSSTGSDAHTARRGCSTTTRGSTACERRLAHSDTGRLAARTLIGQSRGILRFEGITQFRHSGHLGIVQLIRSWQDFDGLHEISYRSTITTRREEPTQVWITPPSFVDLLRKQSLT
jgi:hypothetical protein